MESPAAISLGTMKRHTLALMAAAMLAAASTAFAEVQSIDLRANPSTILADGQSQATIVISARDASGGPAEDGTRIELSASLGSIRDSVLTVRGVARLQLTSANTPGTAIVTATSGAATATTEVVFTNDANAAFSIPQFVYMQADYLAYSGDRQYADALGHVQVSCGDISVSAGSAQLDLNTGYLIAKGDVVLKGNKVERKAYRVTLDCLNLRGEYQDMDGKVTGFEGPGLNDLPEPEYPDEPDRSSEDLATSDLLIVAKKMRWFPGTTIQFSSARIYLYGTKALSLAHYEYQLSGARSVANQYVGIGPNGLTVSFPYYLSMTESSKNSIVVSRGQRLGWGAYNTIPGWSLGLQRDYYDGDRVTGQMALDNFTGRDWGVFWHDTRMLDKDTHSYFSLDSPNHKDIFGSASLSRGFRGFSANLDLNTNRIENEDNTSTVDLYIRTDPRPFIGKGSTSNWTIRTDYSTQAVEGGQRMQEGLFYETHSPVPWFGHRYPASLATSVGHEWGLSAGDGAAYSLGLNVRPNIWKKAMIRLDYWYTKSPQDTDIAGNNRITATLSSKGVKKLSMSIYGTFSLDTTQWSSFLNAKYALTRSWKLVTRGTWQSLSGYNYRDVEYGISYPVGYQDLQLMWSERRKQFIIELGGARF